MLTFFISYLFGSIPFGLILVYLYTGKDLRCYGSCNIGATNAYRVAGKLVGILTFVLDFCKVVLCMYFANIFIPEQVLLAGIACVFGHNFSIYLKFKGGKGVSSMMCVLFYTNFYAGIFSVFTWLIVFVITRISSIASLAAVMLGVVYIFFNQKNDLYNLILLLVGVGLIFFKHLSNISRILKGEEKRIDI